MSEAEKQRRLLYKLNRQRWIRILAIILGAIVLLTAVFSVLFYHFNQAYYINYVQESHVDYRVQLKENEFYDSPFAEPGKAYITALIDRVMANFAYDVQMDAENVNFEYSYRIDALLEIKTKSGDVIYDHTDAILPSTAVEESGSRISIAQPISVDYGTYNDFVKRFISFNRLKDTQSSLSLMMYIEVIGACEEFSGENSDAYVVSLVVPLSEDVVNMTVSSTVEEGDNQILARENETAKNVFMILTIVFGALTLLGAAAFIAFIYLTRSTDINYEIRRNRILQTYKPFIQTLAAPFETEGYQLLVVESFKDMLEIRDTIQSPILMFENGDKTLTGFYIPTSTKLLYVHELRIEDYDLIYGDGEDDGYLYVEDTAPAATTEKEKRYDARRRAAVRGTTVAVLTVLGTIFKVYAEQRKNRPAKKESVKTKPAKAEE